MRDQAEKGDMATDLHPLQHQSCKAAPMKITAIDPPVMAEAPEIVVATLAEVVAVKIKVQVHQQTMTFQNQNVYDAIISQK